jgi:Mg2+ and Co2+ transporter CorA
MPEITIDAPPAEDPNPTNIRFATQELKGIKKLSRKQRKATHSSLQPWAGWEKDKREPYHEYIHQLASAGWDNLKELDEYMTTDIEDRNLVISVVDITDDYLLKHYPDIRDEVTLKDFLRNESRQNSKIRLYLAEQEGNLASGVIEAFGSVLGLDPRFFQWNIFGSRSLLSPAERHRSPFSSVSFTVPRTSTPSKADSETFRVSIYIKPEKDEDFWTGVILFPSHANMYMSTRTLIRPPEFDPTSDLHMPLPVLREPKTFRQLYMETFDFSTFSLEEATKSPFYAVQYLLRLNGYCWNEVIQNIREEDERIGDISDSSVGQVEIISKTLRLIQRGGSLGWKGADRQHTAEAREKLEEDFRHLKDQAELLWETREKMNSIRSKKAEARWNALTNAFTFFFVPISLISSVYGMNVSQISGSTSNPNIWQFFVACAGLNVLIVLTLAISNWLSVIRKHERKAGVKEIFGFAVGKH